MNNQKIKTLATIALFATMAYGWGQQIVWNIECEKRLKAASGDNAKLAAMNLFLAMKAMNAGVKFDNFDHFVVAEHYKEMTED
jgi:hypothetical protein